MWKIIPCLLLIVAMAGCRTQPPPQADTAVAETPETQPKAGEIPWLTSLDEGLAAAKAQNKPVVVDFFATWCGPCKLMDAEVWPRPEVISAAAGFVPVKVDVDQNQALANEYKIEGVPTMVFLDAAGKETGRQVGMVEADELVKLLNEKR